MNFRNNTGHSRLKQFLKNCLHYDSIDTIITEILYSYNCCKWPHRVKFVTIIVNNTVIDCQHFKPTITFYRNLIITDDFLTQDAQVWIQDDFKWFLMRDDDNYVLEVEKSRWDGEYRFIILSRKTWYLMVSPVRDAMSCHSR